VRRWKTERLEKLEHVIQVVNQCQPDYDFERLKQQYAQQLIGKYIGAMEQLPQDEVTKLGIVLRSGSIIGKK